MSFGPEWFVVLAVIVLLFGAKKLPELARSLGRSTSEFKRGVKEGTAGDDEADASSSTADTKAPGPPESRGEGPSTE